MFVEEELEALKVDSEPIRVQIVSEPYVVFSKFGYQAAVDILLVRRNIKKRLFLSPTTLSKQLEAIRNDNSLNQFAGMEFWISKKSDRRQAPYILSD